MSAMSNMDAELRAVVKEIRTLQSDAAHWTEQNEDICGEDDATWFDTIAEFDERIADAGIRLANLVEQLIGVSE